MSMDLGGAKGGLKADINVTPLVDVMLVLLIIMMVIAPMLQKGVDVKLPSALNIGSPSFSLWVVSLRRFVPSMFATQMSVRPRLASRSVSRTVNARVR